MDIRGLGYVTLLSSDLAQWRHYASQVLGMICLLYTSPSPRDS